MTGDQSSDISYTALYIALENNHRDCSELLSYGDRTDIECRGDISKSMAIVAKKMRRS
jgi:hypothetical protein